MKIEMRTDWMPIINPCVYHTNLGDQYMEVYDEYQKDFENAICKYGIETINDVLGDLENIIGKCVASNASFHNPAEYNFYDDWLEFDLEVPEDILDTIKTEYYSDSEKQVEFLNFARKHYGSYDGFISFFPYTREEFEDTLAGKRTYNFSRDRAIAMYIMYLVSKDERKDPEYTQWQFEDSVIEEGNKNGWYFDEEDEIE